MNQFKREFLGVKRLLINILGGDGCGKSTQIEMLIPWAKINTQKTPRTLVKKDIFNTDQYPECAFFGVSYETLVHDLVPIMKGDCRALWAMFMNLVSIQGHEPQENEIVFIDGFWQKMYATETTMGVNKEWLRSVCTIFSEPDITILINTDPNVIVERGRTHNTYESGCDFSCSDASFLHHQNQVRAILMDMAKEKSYHIVNGNNSKENIFGDITTIIANFLDTSS